MKMKADPDRVIYVHSPHHLSLEVSASGKLHIHAYLKISSLSQVALVRFGVIDLQSICLWEVLAHGITRRNNVAMQGTTNMQV